MVKKATKQVDSGSLPHQFTDVETFYKVQYNEVIDMLVEEISRRFDQASLALSAATESILLKAMNNADDTPMKMADIASKTYFKDINKKRLHNQLQMTPDLATMYKTSQNLKSPNITSIQTICEIMQSVPIAQEMFSESDKLLRIYLTIPVTTATAERLFSALCHAKIYLSSNMTEERLNNIMLLLVH